MMDEKRHCRDFARCTIPYPLHTVLVDSNDWREELSKCFLQTDVSQTIWEIKPIISKRQLLHEHLHMNCMRPERKGQTSAAWGTIRSSQSRHALHTKTVYCKLRMFPFTTKTTAYWSSAFPQITDAGRKHPNYRRKNVDYFSFRCTLGLSLRKILLSYLLHPLVVA